MSAHIYYFDNAATSPLSDGALNAMIPYFRAEFGNPSSGHRMSKKPKVAIAESRKAISRCINCSEDEIYFTSGGTESDNWALISIALKRPGSKIIVSAIEHSAILETCSYLHSIGHPISILPVDLKGHVIATALLNEIDDNTSIVSIMHANNEIGTIQNLEELSKIVHDHGALFHTDAVQSIGHVPIDVSSMGIDLLSASSHKFNGPKGVGFLYCKKGIDLPPIIRGGHQQNGFRAGTENVPGIVGMAHALTENNEIMYQNANHLSKLESILINSLNDFSIDYRINGDSCTKLPGVLSISFKGVKGESILDLLSLRGVCVSTGSACNTQVDVISHVLLAIQVPPEYIGGTIRFSFGKYNREEDVEQASVIISKIIHSLQNHQ